MEKNIEEEMLKNFKEEMKCEDGCDCDCDCECGCGCECEDCNCEDCDCGCECDCENCCGDCDCDCDCEDCCCGWDYEECDCGCCGEDDDWYYADFPHAFSKEAEDILEYCYDDFSEDVQIRGEDYYLDGRVSKVVKNKDGDTYTAKVYGSLDEPYEVSIFVDKIGVDYECTCPCDYPCKHVYATMLAIDDGEYEELELMPNEERKGCTLEELIEKIPAEEFKSYLLKENGLEDVLFCYMKLAKRFSAYLPNQTYEYYYNNLYNRLAFEEEYTLFEYLNEIKGTIAGQEYSESFKIIKAIIEAYNDTHKINEDNELIDALPQLAMYLRVTKRNGSEELKEEIKAWITSIRENKYYDNVYIEDALVELDK